MNGLGKLIDDVGEVGVLDERFVPHRRADDYRDGGRYGRGEQLATNGISGGAPATGGPEY